MGIISGDRTVEIDAPIQRVFDIAADIEGAIEWQGSLREVDVLSTTADGHAEVAETVNHTAVKSVRSQIRFTYDEPTGLAWEQIKGDTKSVKGHWTFEDLGDDRTRATYSLEVDPGRMLGMLIRGPVEGQVTNALLGHAAEGLKKQAESAA